MRADNQDSSAYAVASPNVQFWFLLSSVPRSPASQYPLLLEYWELKACAGHMEEPTVESLCLSCIPMGAKSQVSRAQVGRHMGVICVLGTKGQGLPTSRCSWGMTPPSFFLAASFLPRMSGAYLYHVLMVCEALQCCVFWPSHGTWMGDTHWPSCRHAISGSLHAAPMYGGAMQGCNKAMFGCLSQSFICWSLCARGLISRSTYSQ